VHPIVLLVDLVLSVLLLPVAHVPNVLLVIIVLLLPILFVLYVLLVSIKAPQVVTDVIIVLVALTPWLKLPSVRNVVLESTVMQVPVHVSLVKLVNTVAQVR
jgi:hypothetical protein